MARTVALFLSLLLVFASCRGADGWSEEVDRMVGSAIRQHEGHSANEKERPLAVFDFDNTMIDGDISHSLLMYQADRVWYGFDPADPASRVFPEETAALFASLKKVSKGRQRELIKARIRYKVLQRYYGLWKDTGKEGGLAYLVQVLKGMTPDEVHRLTRESMDHAMGQSRCLREYGPHGLKGEPVSVQEGIGLRSPIRAMIKRLKDAGFDVWVASASPRTVVQEAARAYGIPADKVIGNRSQEKAGRITGDLLTPVTYRKGKVEAIKKFAGRRPVLAFGDAWTDWEMLKWAEHGVLIERGKTDLDEAARKAGILIQPRFPGEPQWRPCENR
ncbi:MAG: HAD-IB family phosphatase [Deltaproteobacteria bacterium]|nr:HAD-IB family phosphatase [Deltaproteobacteria bacterium]